MRGLSIADGLRADVRGYTELIDRASRTSARARVLHRLDELVLEPTDDLVVREVSAPQLDDDPVLRGAIVVHLDLMFRSSVTEREVRVVAEHGVVLVAEHPALRGFPVAVVLGSLAESLCERRDQLFEVPNPPAPDCSVVIPFALAASPRGLGSGRALLRALIARCAQWPRPPRITTFSPLTGMRAHVIRCVDDSSAWGAAVARAGRIDAKLLQRQLLALLSLDTAPPVIAEPARAWLQREASEFAASSRYAVGNFHRGMGARLTGVLETADPSDSDALWWRAWFDYGRDVTR